MIGEFLINGRVVMVKCTGLRNKLDKILTNRSEFCFPESIVFSFIVKIEVYSSVIELTVLQTGHQCLLIELSQLCPCDARKLPLGIGGVCRVTAPPLLRDGDSKTLSSVKSTSSLQGDLSVQLGENGAFGYVIENGHGSALEPLDYIRWHCVE